MKQVNIIIAGAAVVIGVMIQVVNITGWDFSKSVKTIDVATSTQKTEPQKPKPELRGGNFSTLNACIEAIITESLESGQTMKMYTDTPTEVSGALSDGRMFSCNKKITGTNGTYFSGWYQIN